MRTLSYLFADGAVTAADLQQGHPTAYTALQLAGGAHILHVIVSDSQGTRLLASMDATTSLHNFCWHLVEQRVNLWDIPNSVRELVTSAQARLDSDRVKAAKYDLHLVLARYTVDFNKYPARFYAAQAARYALLASDFTNKTAVSLYAAECANSTLIAAGASFEDTAALRVAMVAELDREIIVAAWNVVDAARDEAAS